MHAAEPFDQGEGKNESHPLTGNVCKDTGWGAKTARQSLGMGSAAVAPPRRCKELSRYSASNGALPHCTMVDPLDFKFANLRAPCSKCGRPLILTRIEPGKPGARLRTITVPHAKAPKSLSAPSDRPGYVTPWSLRASAVR